MSDILGYLDGQATSKQRIEELKAEVDEWQASAHRDALEIEELRADKADLLAALQRARGAVIEGKSCSGHWANDRRVYDAVAEIDAAIAKVCK